MRTSKSAVFLFELMIIILVFSLAAAICTQIFASAYKMSTESRELTMSSINAQTIAEEFKAGEPDIEPLYFDKNWAASDQADAYYRVELDENDSITGVSPPTGGSVAVGSNIREAFVNVFKLGDDQAIYTLHVKEFVG